MKRAALRDLYAAVQEHRRRTGESQADMARRLGLSRSGLANLERALAEGRAISWDSAEVLAWAIGWELRAGPRGG